LHRGQTRGFSTALCQLCPHRTHLHFIPHRLSFVTDTDTTTTPADTAQPDKQCFWFDYSRSLIATNGFPQPPQIRRRLPFGYVFVILCP